MSARVQFCGKSVEPYKVPGTGLRWLQMRSKATRVEYYLAESAERVSQRVQPYCFGGLNMHMCDGSTCEQRVRSLYPVISLL